MQAQDSLKQLIFNADTILVANQISDTMVNGVLMTTDKLRQVYLLDDENVLTKFNAKGQALFNYHSNIYGPPAHIDATDPFHVLLFYPDFGRVILLDRTLSAQDEIDLFNLNLEQVSGVGLSNDNNVWLYDNFAFKIKKISRRGKVLYESDNLIGSLQQEINPNFILEKNNWLYLNDPEVGILVFDRFGHYSMTYELKGLRQFQVLDNFILYNKDSEWKTFNLKTFEKLPLHDLPKDDRTQIRLEKNSAFLLTKDQLKFYKF